MLGAGGEDQLELLDRAAGGAGRLRFLPDEPEPVTLADLWRSAASSARWLSRRASPGGAVAMVLSSSSAAVSALLGTWRAGLCAASLPTPARGMRLEEYQRQVEAMCAAVEAELLLVPDDVIALLPPLRLPVAGFAECHADSGGCADGGGSLVQFTSGSTATPKGIRLSLHAVAANVLAILDTLAPQPGDATCSWLPLSHDMGLVGMLLTPWCATAPDLLGRGDLCLIRPEHFLRNPPSWLEACSQLGATVTAAPDFAFGLAARTIAAAKHLDLRRLRVCITGGETVRADTLETFTRATADAGFDSRAFCPAYGMAEATLAVTMVRPGEHWSAVEVDGAALANGRWESAAAPAVRRVVSAGAPLPGMQVRVGGADTGVIEVRGPSMLSEYVGAGSPLSADGWLATTDVGRYADGQLWPVGRRGDRLVVAGRNLDAQDIEERVGERPGVRRGAVAAVEDGTGGFAIVAEAADSADIEGLAWATRDELVRSVGLGPSAVVFVERGTLPKTPSGKMQRHRVAAALETGELAEVSVVRFRAASW